MRKGAIGALSQSVGGVIPQQLQKRIGVWTNLGDIMFVAARKNKTTGGTASADA